MSDTSNTDDTNMIRIHVGSEHYRTKSIDRVARRLFGPKARAVVETNKETGMANGIFVTPDRDNPNILHVRQYFEQEEDLPVGKRRRAPKKSTSRKSGTIIRDDEGHSVRIAA